MQSEGCSTLQIAKLLRCDHWTIKSFILNTQHDLKKCMEKKRHKLTSNPLASSATIFQNCNLSGLSRSTRCQVLRDMAKVREAEIQLPLNKTNKLKRHDWAKKYLKTDFSKVLWADEMRVRESQWVGPWVDH